MNRRIEKVRTRKRRQAKFIYNQPQYGKKPKVKEIAKRPPEAMKVKEEIRLNIAETREQQNATQK